MWTDVVGSAQGDLFVTAPFRSEAVIISLAVGA